MPIKASGRPTGTAGLWLFALKELRVWNLFLFALLTPLGISSSSFQRAGGFRVRDGELPESSHVEPEPHPVSPAQRHDAVPPRLTAGGHRQLQGILHSFFHAVYRTSNYPSSSSPTLLLSSRPSSRGVFSWSPTTRCVSTWRGWVTWRWGSSTRASKLRLKSCWTTLCWDRRPALNTSKWNTSEVGAPAHTQTQTVKWLYIDVIISSLY